MKNTEEVREETIEIIYDLIRINNDRVAGYENAANEIRDSLDAEIKSIFFQMADESRNYKAELSAAVIRLGGTPANDSTAAGKIYRAWMDVKATFSGDDILAALQSCEFGEDAALRAYKDALHDDLELPPAEKALVETQYESLKASHNRIKRYRDEYAAASKATH